MILQYIFQLKYKLMSIDIGRVGYGCGELTFSNIKVIDLVFLVEQNIYISQMQDEESEQNVPFTQRYGNSLENLKLSLEKAWSQRNIHVCYRNSVMAYINCMDSDQAKVQIISEQSKLMSNKSIAIKIQAMITERQNVLANLITCLEGEVNLEDACSLIDQLRKINLKLCESILGIKESLQKRSIKSDCVIKGYSSFFKKLNTDNIPIITSYLKDFINFTSSFDPLFLHPYQTIQAEGNAQDLPDEVSKLFKMNISYVYRLIKVRNQLIKYLSSINLSEEELQENLQDQSHMRSTNGKRSSTLQNKRQVPKKILMVRAKKYQTISQEEQIESPPPPINRKFVRRYISKSEPKSSLSALEQERSQEQNYGQVQKIKKFKIREVRDKSKSSNVRFRTQEYDMTEDDDINFFRKKMRARRQRRKKISITDRRDSEQSEEQINIKQKTTLDLKRSKVLNLSQSLHLKSKTQTIQHMQQSQSSEEQIMEPRGLDQIPNKTGLDLRYGKIRSVQSSKIRQSIRNKKQKIKLQPIMEFSLKSRQREAKVETGQQNELYESLNRKRMQKYFALSPEIKQVNNQSSSSRSQQKQQGFQQAYTGQRQEELFKNINRKSQQKIVPHKNAFRVKKISYGEAAEDSQHQKSSWAQSEQIIPIQQTNQQKFKDGHIRKLKGVHELPSKRESSKDATIMNDKAPRDQISKKNEAKSPSRLAVHLPDSKDPNKQRPQQFSLSGIQQSEQKNKRNQTEQQKRQNILKQIQQELQQNPNKKKQIKMKPGQIKLGDLYQFIQKQKIHQFQRKQFQIGLWKENINLKHSYLTKFYMNSELAAFGISSPRCDGDFSILYWGTTCAQSFTAFLFKKYLDYLQKFTNLNNIYINNEGYLNSDFVQKGSYFIRGRKNFSKRELPYIPFLSFQCSNICFEQKTVHSDLSIFFSQQIQQFSQQNSKVNKFIILCDPETQKIKYPENAMFYNNINSISEVNSILQSSKIDTYATSQKIQIQKCKLFTLKDSCSIKSNYFYVRNGYFVPQGKQIFSKQKQKILKLQMGKEEYSIYFGKKFTSIENFVSLCNPGGSGPVQSFAFKMFSKQLYGRIKTDAYASFGCYGNWDINFLWQDQLKGTVIKDMPSSQYIFGPESFYAAIYKSQTLLFAFQVKPSDFFF